eukprot:gene3484-6930_t
MAPQHTSYGSIFAELTGVTIEVPVTVTLLTKQYRKVLMICIIVYVTLQLLTGLAKAMDVSVCNDPYIFPNWVFTVNLVVALCFLLSALSILLRMLPKQNGRSVELYSYLAANLTIKTIAGSSSFLTLTANWGGVCRDGFGVLSAAAQFSEWLVCVPLLIYIAVSCEVKNKLSWKDKAVIILMGLAIFLGRLPIFFTGYYLNFILIFLSCACVLSVFYLVIDAHGALAAALSRKPVISLENIDAKANTLCSKLAGGHSIHQSYELCRQKKSLESALIRQNLAVICFIAMPIFPLIYFFSLFKILNDDIAYTSTMVVSMLVKVFIATIVTEGHITALEDINYTITMHNLDVEADEINKVLSFKHNKHYKVKIGDSMEKLNIKLPSPLK